MERKKDSVLNPSSSYGTMGGTELISPSTTTDNDVLNTDEDTLSTAPLRSDLESGMDTDLSSGVTSGPNFMGNLDSDTDAGLSYASTNVSDTYAIPSAINTDLTVSEGKKPLDVAKDSITDAKTTLSSATETAKTQVSELAEQAKVKVGELTSQATDKVKEQLDGHKVKATEGLTTITDAIRQTASSLEEKGQTPIAGAVTGFAGQIENFASYLQGKSVDELAEDVTVYAKQNPQVFIGGAFLLGIAIARFLKSSNRNDAGYYNTSTVTTGSNSFNNTPVIPASTYSGTTAYTTDTTYKTGTPTYNSGTTLGYESTEGTVI